MNSRIIGESHINEVIAGFINTVMAEQGEDTEVEADEDLVDFGFDSVGYVRLLSFIREEFGISVPDADVTIDNFGSVNAVADYLTQRIDSLNGQES